MSAHSKFRSPSFIAVDAMEEQKIQKVSFQSNMMKGQANAGLLLCAVAKRLLMCQVIRLSPCEGERTEVRGSKALMDWSC